jgi:osmotically-inducible protein OsmY
MKVEADVEARVRATAKVFGIIALAAVLSGCAVAMLGGAARSGGSSGASGTAGSSNGAASPATSRSSSQLAADNAISTGVRSRFSANAGLRALKLTVDTHDGIVTLRGQVNDDGQRKAAQLEARAVSGVKAVKNELVVK